MPILSSIRYTFEVLAAILDTVLDVVCYTVLVAVFDITFYIALDFVLEVEGIFLGVVLDTIHDVTIVVLWSLIIVFNKI